MSAFAEFHACLVGLGIMLAAPAAATEPIPSSTPPSAVDDRSPGLSLALPIGVGVVGHEGAVAGLAWGARGEIGMAWARRAEGWGGRGRGALLYGELLGLDGLDGATRPGLLAGGGLAYVEYLGGFAVSPSVGLHTRPATVDGREGGLTFGLFLGYRSARRHSAFDLPFGVRVDAHTGIGGTSDTLVIASVSGDLVGLIGAAVLSVQILAVGGA